MLIKTISKRRMFEHTSRYSKIQDVYMEDGGGDGVQVAYKRRRFLPKSGTGAVDVVVSVNEDDRLDIIAANKIGDPLQFWRIADANDAMDPFDLTATPGRTLVVPTVHF